MPIFIVFFLSSLFSMTTWACQTLVEAQSEYQNGKTSEAIRILECLKKSEPENADAQRFLIDIYWWEGITSKAEPLSISLLENNKNKNDYDLLSHLASIV